MIKINPFFVEKIWAGDKINKMLKTTKNKIGEAWIVSAYEGRESTLNNGQKLSQFYFNNKALFGNYPTKKFPILIKFLDAKDELSLQVHPNNKVAQKLEKYEFGKSESWYIIETDHNKIIAGTHAKSKQELRQLIINKNWDRVGATVKINVDDFIHIEGGTIHAIKSGTFLYELQQSSDITYDIYDYDRLENGKPRRPLNLTKVMKATSIINNLKPAPIQINKNITQFIDKIYGLARVKLFNNEIVEFLIPTKYFAMATNISNNEIKIKSNKEIVVLKPWETYIIFNTELRVYISGKGKLLISWAN